LGGVAVTSSSPFAFQLHGATWLAVIALGVAYALPGEAIINALWSNGDRWLPGQLLSALAHGGTSSASYAHALLTLVVYAAVVGAGTLMLFQRRDV